MTWPDPSMTRWLASSRRPTTGDIRALPVQRVVRHGLSLGKVGFVWQWSRDGEATASIGARVSHDEAGAVLILEYRLNGAPMVDRVRLTSSPCRFGGARWLAICPKTGRRVSRLYLGRSGALSRHAYGLAFDSQRESPLDRSFRRRQKVLDKLKTDSPLVLARPKGMHHRTFGRLLVEAEREARFFAVAVRERFGSGFDFDI